MWLVANSCVQYQATEKNKQTKQNKKKDKQTNKQKTHLERDTSTYIAVKWRHRNLLLQHTLQPVTTKL